MFYQNNSLPVVIMAQNEDHFKRPGYRRTLKKRTHGKIRSLKNVRKKCKEYDSDLNCSNMPFAAKRI